MAKFHGRFDYSTDSKGRVNIPSKFRAALSSDANDTFVICRAPGNCLRAYPYDVWDAYENDLSSRPETQETLNHKRLLYNTLTESTLDAQGRITLSGKQLEIAGIEKEITVVGQANYIELWNTARYEAYQHQCENDFDKIFFHSVETGMTRK